MKTAKTNIMSEKYIFVSYSRKDKRTFNKVVEILKEKGIPVWMDVSGIESGDQFKYIIVSAIERCEAVLYFASENSNASHWTAKEIGIATLVASILWTLLGLYQAFGALLRAPDISPVVIFGGLRVSLISTIYGIVIYLISLIIRIVQKPRI